MACLLETRECVLSRFGQRDASLDLDVHINDLVALIVHAGDEVLHGVDLSVG